MVIDARLEAIVWQIGSVKSTRYKIIEHGL